MISDGILFRLYIKTNFTDSKSFNQPVFVGNKRASDYEISSQTRINSKLDCQRSSCAFENRISLATGFRNLKIMMACVSMLKVSGSIMF